MTGQYPTPPTVAVARRPTQVLLGLGVTAASGVALSAIYSVTGHGLGCPFRAITGWDCPLCGGTRLGAALLDLDVAAAFAYNPLVFVALLVATGWGIGALVQLARGGSTSRPAGRLTALRARLAQVRPTTWTLLGLALAVAYTVARHLWFPVPA